MTTLTVTSTTDYSGQVLAGYDAITFTTANPFGTTAIFAAAQFDGVQLSTSVTITGDSHPNEILIVAPFAGTFSMASWSFANWSAADYVQIEGSSGADTIISAWSGTLVNGGGGADTLIGSSAFNRFIYLAPTDIVAGETVSGGGGNDEIDVHSDGTYDFSSISISGVAILANAGLGIVATLMLNGDQIGAGAITKVQGAHTTLVVTGPSVDLSAVTFDFWDADDTITIIGTAGANTLTGSNQNDVINGLAGADHMIGGAGSDLYLVDNLSDVVDESMAGSSGLDTVLSSVGFNLGNAAHAKGSIENLVLAGLAGIAGTGSGLANVIVGNNGANALSGGGGGDFLKGRGGNDALLGGTGNDKLTGGGGNDAFFFTSALGGAPNVDRIGDFSIVHDLIKLKHAVFSHIAIGALSSDAFHAGPTAADAEDRILYVKPTGRVFYDPDGTGVHAKVLFAILDNHANLTAADLVVVA